MTRNYRRTGAGRAVVGTTMTLAGVARVQRSFRGAPCGPQPVDG
jgi:hypothetical protein